MATSRPRPSTSPAAKMLYIAGGTISTALFVVIGFALRETFTLWKVGDIPGSGMAIYRTLPTALIALIALPFALVPGFALGWLAARRKPIRRLRCRSCGWSDSFPVSAVWAAPKEAASRATLAPVVSDSPVFNIVDDDTDAWKEATAWTRAELREGRLPENIEADLLAQGWPRDDVEGMVERCRREARER